MPDDVAWIRSYVLEERDGSLGTVCVYQASSPEAIRRHASGCVASGGRNREGRRHRDRATGPGRSDGLRERETMRLQRNLLVVAVAALIAMVVPLVASAARPAAQPGDPELLATLAGGAGSGSTVGPGGALYVTQPATGEIWRIDPKSGAGEAVRQRSAAAVQPASVRRRDGRRVHRLDRICPRRRRRSRSFRLTCSPVTRKPSVSTAWTGLRARPSSRTSARLPATIRRHRTSRSSCRPAFSTRSETYRGGFLVTDGHHNRVLRVSRDGTITELIAFGDLVPTGLDVSGNRIYLAEAGPYLTCLKTARSSRSSPDRRTSRGCCLGCSPAVDVESSAAAERSSLSLRATSHAAAIRRVPAPRPHTTRAAS